MHQGFNFYTAKGAQRSLILGTDFIGTGLGRPIMSGNQVLAGRGRRDHEMRLDQVYESGLFVCTYSSYKLSWLCR
jgi:hypothetical protein